MASIAAKHHVILKDQSGAQVAFFDKYTKIEFQRVVNDVGYFIVEFYDDGDSRFDLFELDGQVEIWRTVPALGLDWYCEFAGFFRKKERNISADGKRLLTFSGFGYNHLLSRRVISYKQGTIRSEKDDYAEDVMKEYVDENCAASASHASRIGNGQFTGFTVDGPSAFRLLTPNWKGERAFRNLLDVLQEISNYTRTQTPASRALDFAVEANGAAAFIFKTYVDQLGTDHSESSSDPVIFSVDMATLSDVEFVSDRTAEVTRAVVLGSGERSTRKVIARNNLTAQAESPWNTIENAITSSLNEFEYQLNMTGDEELETRGAIVGFTGVPIQQPSARYGLHYTLGDIVTIRDGSTSYDKKIISVKISVDDRGVESVDIDWEDIKR